jgi:hypothetical protein
MLKIRN